MSKSMRHRRAWTPFRCESWEGNLRIGRHFPGDISWSQWSLHHASPSWALGRMSSSWALPGIERLLWRAANRLDLDNWRNP